MSFVRLSRTIAVDGKFATVQARVLRGDAGDLRFDLIWWGEPPEHMPTDFSRQVDEAKRKAITEIRAELEGLREAFRARDGTHPRFTSQEQK